MPRRHVDLNVLEPFRTLLPRLWLRRVALRALDIAAPGEACALSLTFTDDEAVRSLNRQYRGLDETTDVLAFSAAHPGHWEGEGDPPSSFLPPPLLAGEGNPAVEGSRHAPSSPPPPLLAGEVDAVLPRKDRGEVLPFILPPDEPTPVGEVVVSVPQAQRQAQTAGHGLDREVALLIVHGVLHLVGHDHAEPEETAVMQAKEREALSRVFPEPVRA